MFRQSSPSRSAIDYSIEFDYPQPFSEVSGPDILANFEVSVPPEIDQASLLITGDRGTVVSPSIVNVGWRREVKEELVITSAEDHLISLSVTDFADRENKLLEIQLPSIGFYGVCHSVLNNSMNKKLEEKITKITGEDTPDSYIDFLKIAATAMNFDDVISITSKFSAYNPDFRNWFETNRGDILVDIILGKNSWKYQNLQSLDRLSDYIAEINSYSNLPSTELEGTIKFALRRVEENKHPSPELMIDLIDRLDLIIEKPHLIREHQFALSLAEQILGDEFRRAPELVASYIDKPERDTDAQTFFDEANDEDDYDKKYEIYRAALRIADVDDTFRYAVANYLYWYAETIEGTDQGYVVPTIFNAAAEVFGDLGAESFKVDAKYSQHFRSGLHFQYRNQYKQAADCFESALEVAEEYPEDRRQQQILNARPYFYETKAKALAESSDYQSAIGILSEGIETIETLDEEHPDIISGLEGQRFLYRAEQRMYENDYRTAAKLTGRAIEKFSGVDDSDRDHAIRVRKKLDAFINERDGNFDDASDLHSELADYYGDKPIGWFHMIREAVCDTKSLLMKNEFQKARQRLEKLKKGLSGEHLREEPGELMDLIKTIEDYHEDRETNYTELDIFNNTSTQKEANSEDEDDQYALTYEYDYTGAIRTGLTAQRLKLSGIDTRMLDPIVEAAIEKTIIADRSSLVEEHGLDEVPVSKGWQADLPEYVLIRIEDLRIDRDFNHGSFRGPLEDMTSTVEVALEPAIEYYGKIYWGDEWRKEIAIEEGREPEDSDNISLGHILQFFNSEAVESVDGGEEVKDLLNKSINDASNFAELRNLFDHGWVTRLSEDEFKNILNHGLKILRACAKITPVIGKVESSNIEGTYSVRLQWGQVYRKVLIRDGGGSNENDNLDLSVGEYYYFPQKFGIGRSAVYPMDANEVVQCSMDRVKTNLQD